jgi:hypothetical protein
VKIDAANRQSKSSAPHRAVYDGRERLGSIEQHGDEYVARGKRGQVIGRYDSAIEAANAIGQTAARVAS